VLWLYFFGVFRQARNLQLLVERKTELNRSSAEGDCDEQAKRPGAYAHFELSVEDMDLTSCVATPTVSDVQEIKTPSPFRDSSFDVESEPFIVKSCEELSPQPGCESPTSSGRGWNKNWSRIGGKNSVLSPTSSKRRSHLYVSQTGANSNSPADTVVLSSGGSRAPWWKYSPSRSPTETAIESKKMRHTKSGEEDVMPVIKVGSDAALLDANGRPEVRNSSSDQSTGWWWKANKAKTGPPTALSAAVAPLELPALAANGIEESVSLPLVSRELAEVHHSKEVQQSLRKVNCWYVFRVSGKPPFVSPADDRY